MDLSEPRWTEEQLAALNETDELDAAFRTKYQRYAPVEELLSLPFLQPDQITDSLHAYQLSKRGNSLRVMAEAVRWGGPRGESYRRMIEASAAGRAGTPDEVATVAALLMGSEGGCGLIVSEGLRKYEVPQDIQGAAASSSTSLQHLNPVANALLDAMKERKPFRKRKSGD